MKPLPRQWKKVTVYLLYGNQYNSFEIKQTIIAFQKQVGQNIRKHILTKEVKELIMKEYGLPEGYEIVEPK